VSLLMMEVDTAHFIQKDERCEENDIQSCYQTLDSSRGTIALLSETEEPDNCKKRSVFTMNVMDYCTNVR
jgi:hypothetical protein